MANSKRKTIIKKENRRILILGIIAVALLIILIFSYFLTKAVDSSFLLTQGEWSASSSDVISGRDVVPDKYEWKSDEIDLDTDDSVAQLKAAWDKYNRWEDMGKVVSQDAETQVFPSFISDGSGGIIITWSDDRNTTLEVYAQRLSRSCVTSAHDDYRCWENGEGSGDWDGIPISQIDANDEFYSSIASDGAGGAVIVWGNGADMNYYAQRIGSDGDPVWIAPVSVSDYSGDSGDGAGIFGFTVAPKILFDPDSSDSVMVLWGAGENNIPGDGTIWIQKIKLSDGSPYNDNWGDGKIVSAVSGLKGSSAMVTDGLGGAVVVFANYSTNDNLYIQRINEDCNNLGDFRCWDNAGDYDSYPLSADPADNESFPQMVYDYSGNVIVVWQDDDGTAGAAYNVYINKISINIGGNAWGSTQPVAVLSEDQGAPNLMIDEDTGNVIVVWKDNRGGDYDIYAQRIDPSDGSSMWSSNGIGVSIISGIDQGDLTGVFFNEPYISIISDSIGGAIISWHADRSGLGEGDSIYAQRVNDSDPSCMGSNYRCWDASMPSGDYEGAKVIGANSVGRYNPKMIPDGAGGAFILPLEDGTSDIYAQRINDLGYEFYGELDSVVFDTLYTKSNQYGGYQMSLNSIEWTGTLDVGTSIEVYIRSVEDYPDDPLPDWDKAPVVTIDSSDTSPKDFDTSPLAIGRFFQYRLVFKTANVAYTPQLDEIKLSGSSVIPPLPPDINSFTSNVSSLNKKLCYEDPLNPTPITLTWNIADTDLTLGTETECKISVSADPLPADPLPADIDIDGTTLLASDSIDLACPAGMIRNTTLTYTLSCKNPTSEDYASSGARVVGKNSQAALFSLSPIKISFTPAPSYDKKEPVSEPTIEPAPKPIEEELPKGCDVTLEELRSEPLGYFPPQCGLNFWRGSQILWAQEHRDNIYGLYTSILKRNPCSWEVNWWLERYCDINNVRAGIIDSIEYRAKYGS